jgi:hypothetical protein
VVHRRREVVVRRQHHLVPVLVFVLQMHTNCRLQLFATYRRRTRIMYKLVPLRMYYQDLR